jgi:hypothetical protein
LIETREAEQKQLGFSSPERVHTPTPTTTDRDPTMTNLDQLLTQIANQHLRIDTLETRNSDSLDFHDLAVWTLRAALQAAYQAGVAECATSALDGVRGADA